MDNHTVFTSQPLSHTVGAIINASPRQWLPYAIALVVGYPLLARSLRYRRVNKTLKKYNYPTRESMAKMTDEEAYQIQKQLGSFEFPFMFLKALQFALFRVKTPISFSISSLSVHHGRDQTDQTNSIPRFLRRD